MISKLILLYLLLVTCSYAADLPDYKLIPEKIATDTYVFTGLKEDFSHSNGGNIVNTGFIVAEEGVIVIDTGPSFIYGQQMREAIKKITDKEILKVLITHHHPDHFLGNQAFRDVPIYALPDTIELLKQEASGFLDNVYRLVGSWMKGTEFDVMDIKPLLQRHETFTNHSVDYISKQGHTASDLLVFDATTGVLFAGDQVFHNRALTTPHAEPEKWLRSLDEIENIDYKIIVPGHGEISEDKEPVKQTRDYLVWLETIIQEAVEDGLDMNEVLLSEIPERFLRLAIVKREFTRSVSHRFPFYENRIIFSQE